jgi:SnoaL-like domain
VVVSKSQPWYGSGREVPVHKATERAKAKVGAREAVTPINLRVTMIMRPEDGVWKIVHRHADPITTAQPAESIIQP